MSDNQCSKFNICLFICICETTWRGVTESILGFLEVWPAGGGRGGEKAFQMLPVL